MTLTPTQNNDLYFLTSEHLEQQIIPQSWKQEQHLLLDIYYQLVEAAHNLL